MNTYKNLEGKPGGKRPLRNMGVDGSIILKWNLIKRNGDV
jgi:hypothetical protein